MVNQYNTPLYYDLNNKKQLMKCAQLSDNINKYFNILDFVKQLLRCSQSGHSV